MSDNIHYKILDIAFPIILLFAILLIILQPAFSYTLETKLSWNTLINDVGLAYAIVSNDKQQINLLLDDSIGEEREAFGIFAFPNQQNSEINNIQYYPPPGYYPPPLPQPYHEEFVLTVRLISGSDKYNMPDYTVTVQSGGTEYIKGEEFEDDGKAKVKFYLNKAYLYTTESVCISDSYMTYCENFDTRGNQATVNLYVY